MAQAETISDGLDESFGPGAALTLALMKAELVRGGTASIIAHDDFWATRPQLPEDAPDFGCSPTAR